MMIPNIAWGLIVISMSCICIVGWRSGAGVKEPDRVSDKLITLAILAALESCTITDISMTPIVNP